MLAELIRRAVVGSERTPAKHNVAPIVKLYADRFVGDCRGLYGREHGIVVPVLNTWECLTLSVNERLAELLGFTGAHCHAVSRCPILILERHRLNASTLNIPLSVVRVVGVFGTCNDVLIGLIFHRRQTHGVHVQALEQCSLEERVLCQYLKPYRFQCAVVFLEDATVVTEAGHEHLFNR